MKLLRVCLVRWIRRDKEGWDGVILFFMVFYWEAILSIKDERQGIWDKLILKNHGWAHPSPLASLVVTYEDLITLVIPQIKHESGWVYPFFSSLKSNTRWDKLIPDIMDDPIPSLINTHPNAPYVYGTP
jgi:hypothetical protein